MSAVGVSERSGERNGEAPSPSSPDSLTMTPHCSVGLRSMLLMSDAIPLPGRCSSMPLRMSPGRPVDNNLQAPPSDWPLRWAA
jgi:hypothetical protein